MMHLVDHITPTNKFAIDEKLRESGPFTVHTNLFSDDCIVEDVDVFVVFELVEFDDFDH